MVIAWSRCHQMSCSKGSLASQILKSIKWPTSYFDPSHDRCYCTVCWRSETNPDTLMRGDPPCQYVIPKGWTRFGLTVLKARVDHDDVWKKYHVGFHGANPKAIKSIIPVGFDVAGDVLLDGQVLGGANSAGRKDGVVYTSPSVEYAGLPLYARPQLYNSRVWYQMALQVRQKPGSYTVQGETMGIQGKWPVCEFTKESELERLSKSRKSVIPYGLLIRVITNPIYTPQSQTVGVDRGATSRKGNFVWNKPPECL